MSCFGWIIPVYSRLGSYVIISIFLTMVGAVLASGNDRRGHNDCRQNCGDPTRRRDKEQLLYHLEPPASAQGKVINEIVPVVVVVYAFTDPLKFVSGSMGPLSRPSRRSYARDAFGR